ncbi:MAG: calcium/sodium antiporter [Phycisphaerales bacterium]|nr:calcium/sodium antiporter [Phycisphaerales bacterium]
MPLNIALMVVGAAILVGGGEILIRGAAALARTLGISATIVGLTVVAYGTSAPEFVVSVMATLDDKPGICAGNIVGSNILNVLLVLGVTALIYPIQATAVFVRREVPIMVGVSVLFLFLSRNGDLARPEAAVLVFLLFGYTALTVWIAKREKASVAREYEDVQPSPMKRTIAVNLLLIVVGLAMLGGGSELFLRGAVEIAKAIGISDSIIGLTLVAFGTSFPELAACVVAAYRKHPDICLGNVIGSSIYNLLAIGGISGLITPLPFEPDMIRVHIPLMAGAAVLLWPMVTTSFRISRREGLILLTCYTLFMIWTILRQTR